MREFSAWSRLLALAHYAPPLLAGRTPVELLRRHRLQAKLRSWSPAKRLLGTIFATAAWPIVAVHAIRQNAGAARLRGADRGLPKLRIRAWTMAVLHGLGPTEYFAFRLFEADGAERARQTLAWTDVPALQELNRALGADPTLVDDKRRFAQHCETHNLPHLRSIVDPDMADEEALANLSRVPEGAQLWSKSRSGRQGRGAAQWQRQGTHFADASGILLTAGELLARMRATDSLLQHRLRPHPQLADLAQRATPTLRIITALPAHGSAEHVCSYLVLPSGLAETTTGAHLATLDPRSGTIDLCWAADGRSPSPDHPESGSLLAGRPIPFWHESLALALRAHTNGYAEFASLGWDVVPTQDGPVLLETNAGWDVSTPQLLYGPLGRGPLGRVIAQATRGTA